MAPIIFLGVLAIGLVLLFNILASSRFGMKAVLTASVLLSFPMMFVFGVCWLQCVATFFLSIVCLLFKIRPKTFQVCSIVALLVNFAWATWIGVSSLLEIQTLRRKYPIESLAERLAYESQPASRVNSAEMAPTESEFDPDVWQRMKDLRYSERGNVRRSSLNTLHEAYRDDFVVAQGFGLVRMLRPREKYIALPDYQPILLPRALSHSERFSKTTIADARELVENHFLGLQDFLEVERMGSIQDRQHVAGFQSHGFTKMPSFAIKSAGAANPKPVSESVWELSQLQLISLLKHEEPAAYVSPNLPQLDALQNVRTRPLNLFEQTALQRLRRQTDVVIDDGDKKIKMFGSLRATEQCLKCHSVRVGDLLGAFSYRFSAMD